jgi:autoinducer 2 (AI-2) kinase
MKRQPDIAGKTQFYTSISDWIGYELTGKAVWERAQAMHSAVYDIRKGDFTGELCEIFGIDYGQLPPAANAGTVLGKIKKEIAADLGISSDTVFVTGTADTQGAIAGVDAEVGEVVVINGTTSPCTEVRDSIVDAAANGCWFSPHCYEGQFMLEVNAAYTGINYQNFKNMFFPDKSYTELEDEAMKRGLPKCMFMFSHGLMLGEAPALNGGIIMRNSVDTSLTPADFAHALILNNVFSVCDSLKRLYTISGNTKDYIIGCGGGFRGPITAQAVADISGKTVRICEDFDQATIIGGAMLCNKALGFNRVDRKIISESKPGENKQLEEYYNTWKEFRNTMKNMNFSYPRWL